MDIYNQASDRLSTGTLLQAIASWPACPGATQTTEGDRLRHLARSLKRKLRGQLQDSWIRRRRPRQERRICHESSRGGGERILRGVDRCIVRPVGHVKCFEDELELGVFVQFDIAGETHIG